jgi:gliding motility-associated-like protein
LLFYSDGVSVWNANHQRMPNGNGLRGGSSTAQGACIVPVINDSGKYYLFTLATQGATPSLHYSIVDMSLNGGLGDIEVSNKNILLSNDTLSESMIAVPGDNCDVWLLVHTFKKPEFYAYHITKDGLDTNPVISRTGFEGDNSYWIGCMAISPERNIIALSSSGCSGEVMLGGHMYSLGALIAQFDPSTGKVSNSFKVLSNDVNGNDSKLYITTEVSSDGSYRLLQYDVSEYDSLLIVSSKDEIYNMGNLGAAANWHYLRLYNDTIYMSNNGINIVSSINRPNLSGGACDFNPTSKNIDCRIGLGSDVIYPLPPDTTKSVSLDTLICTTFEEEFRKSIEVAAPFGYYGYEWNDGDTLIGKEITQPGIYWVLSKDSCHSRIDTFKVRHVDISFSLGVDTFLCDLDSYTLSVSVPGATYQWQDGSTDSFYTLKNEDGTYWVHVFKDGCLASDSINISIKSFDQGLGNDTIVCRGEPFALQLHANVPSGAMAQWNTGSNESVITVTDTGVYWVEVVELPCRGADTISIMDELCECFFQMPNAFSPNNDGINDVFLPLIEPSCAISSYIFNIYNRFGERVFSSIDPSKGWDGIYKGRISDVGSYFYEISFIGGTRHKKYYGKGDLQLIK